MKTKTMTWCVWGLLIIWGFVSFMVLAGEDNPEHPMTIGHFILIKALAGVSLVACYLTGTWLVRKGYYPEVDE